MHHEAPGSRQHQGPCSWPTWHLQHPEGLAPPAQHAATGLHAQAGGCAQGVQGLRLDVAGCQHQLLHVGAAAGATLSVILCLQVCCGGSCIKQPDVCCCLGFGVLARPPCTCAIGTGLQLCVVQHEALQVLLTVGSAECRLVLQRPWDTSRFVCKRLNTGYHLCSQHARHGSIPGAAYMLRAHMCAWLCHTPHQPDASCILLYSNCCFALTWTRRGVFSQNRSQV
jgi:hypothetical protein